MESLAMDMGQMNVGGTPVSSRTLLEVLGYDQDTSFDRPITTQIVSDTNHLSIGGRSGIGAGENIQIMVRDDNIVMDLGRSGIAGEILINSNCEIGNILQILQPIEWILGNTQCGYANMQYYLQQKLYTSNSKKYRQLHRALLLAPSADGQSVVPVYDRQVKFLNLISRGLCTTKAGPYTEEHKDSVTVSRHDVYQFFIPLNEIFPQLKEFPDDLIYLGLGQQLKMNIRLNSNTDCIMPRKVGAKADPADGGANGYSLRQCQLVKVYTKLDAPRADAILRSSLILPKLSYSAYTTQPDDTSVLVFNVTQKDRVKKLYIGCHYNGSVFASAADNSGADTIATFYDTSAALTFPHIKSRLNFMVEMPIEYLHFNFGGETRVFTINQLMLLGYSDILSDTDHLLKDEFNRQFKYVLVIDMERFCKDVFGSSNQSAMNIQVQIQLQKDQTKAGFGSMVSGYNPFAANGADATLTKLKGVNPGYRVYAFLETQQLMALEGVLKMWIRKATRPIYTHQIQDAMDGKFASINALLELSQKLDALPESTAVKVQKQLLANKLQSAFEDFQKLGVSLPDLFAKFQGQLYKADVLQAQDRLKNKEQENGGEPLLTDLINEDMIQEIVKSKNFGNDLQTVELNQFNKEKQQLKESQDDTDEDSIKSYLQELASLKRKYAYDVIGPRKAKQKRIQNLSDPMFQFVSQNLLNTGQNKMSQDIYDRTKRFQIEQLRQQRKPPGISDIKVQQKQEGDESLKEYTLQQSYDLNENIISYIEDIQNTIQKLTNLSENMNNNRMVQQAQNVKDDINVLQTDVDDNNTKVKELLKNIYNKDISLEDLQQLTEELAVYETTFSNYQSQAYNTLENYKKIKSNTLKLQDKSAIKIQTAIKQFQEKKQIEKDQLQKELDKQAEEQKQELQRQIEEKDKIVKIQELFKQSLKEGDRITFDPNDAIKGKDNAKDRLEIYFKEFIQNKYEIDDYIFDKSWSEEVQSTKNKILNKYAKQIQYKYQEKKGKSKNYILKEYVKD